MRTLRKVVDIVLPLLGVAVILGAVLFVRDDLRIELALVGLGMVLIEVGVWKLAHRILPSGRKYLPLRAESDLFLKLVRQLNTAALAVKENDLPENRQAFAEIVETMRQAVDRIAHAAGKTDGDLASERGARG